ncbi:hypothetical protein [Parashewanella tropica]|uniref:hypothetical protein n=1 Tax=Parashewanella tropica TaxID=2547970 RepID=UPI001478A684|nr:hypothetical protein [Parashewanella tropica]
MCAAAVEANVGVVNQFASPNTEATKLQVVLYSPSIHGDLTRYRQTHSFTDLKQQYKQDIERLRALDKEFHCPRFEIAQETFWSHLFVKSDDYKVTYMTAKEFREIAFAGFTDDFRRAIEILEGNTLSLHQRKRLFDNLIHSIELCMPGIQETVNNIHEALDVESNFNVQALKLYKREVMKAVARQHLIGFTDSDSKEALSKNQVHIEDGLVNHFADQFGVPKYTNSATQFGFKEKFLKGYKAKVEAALHPILLTQYVFKQLSSELSKALSEYQALRAEWVCLSELSLSTQEKLKEELSKVGDDELNRQLTGNFCHEAVSSLEVLSKRLTLLEVQNRDAVLLSLTEIVRSDEHWIEAIHIPLDYFQEATFAESKVAKLHSLQKELFKQICGPLQRIAGDEEICTEADLMDANTLVSISVKEIKLNLQAIAAKALEKTRTVCEIKLSRKPEKVLKYTPEGSFFWMVEDYETRAVTMADVQGLHLDSLPDEAVNHLFELTVGTVESFDELLSFLALNQGVKQPNRLQVVVVAQKLDWLIDKKPFLRSQIAASLQIPPAQHSLSQQFCAQFFNYLTPEEQKETTLIVKLKSNTFLSDSEVEQVIHRWNEFELLQHLQHINQSTFNRFIVHVIETDNIEVFEKLKANEFLFSEFVKTGIKQSQLATQMKFRSNLLSFCFEKSAVQITIFLFNSGDFSAVASYGDTLASPLFLAIHLHNAPLVLLVLNQQSAKANLRNAKKEVPLHYALRLYRNTSKSSDLKLVISGLISHIKTDLFMLNGKRQQCLELLNVYEEFRGLVKDTVNKRLEETVEDFEDEGMSGDVEDDDFSSYVKISLSACA